MVDPVLLERARHLAVDERLELVSALLDSIEGDEGELPPEVASLIDQRLAAADAAPSSRSWAEVRADLRKSAR